VPPRALRGSRKHHRNPTQTGTTPPRRNRKRQLTPACSSEFGSSPGRVTDSFVRERTNRLVWHTAVLGTQWNNDTRKCYDESGFILRSGFCKMVSRFLEESVKIFIQITYYYYYDVAETRGIKKKYFSEELQKQKNVKNKKLVFIMILVLVVLVV